MKTNTKTQKEIECNHPRAMLITTQKHNIRCARCKKLWIAEAELSSHAEQIRLDERKKIIKEIKNAPMEFLDFHDNDWKDAVFVKQKDLLKVLKALSTQPRSTRGQTSSTEQGEWKEDHKEILSKITCPKCLKKSIDCSTEQGECECQRMKYHPHKYCLDSCDCQGEGK